MKSVVIAGAGPVGSFMAVLCSLLGLPVTVYEKREEYTRNINLKIESGFFNKVQKVISRLYITSQFFAQLDEYLSNQNNRILIKDLETRCAEEAKSLGAKYIIMEVFSFSYLYEKHRSADPVILDCTGRNSRLRASAFGNDRRNIVTIPLQHAMYINFKGKISDNISLYQTMKYIDSIKLTEVVVSKSKNSNGYSNVTLPVFINEKLARDFDRVYPNINRHPLNPFHSSEPVPDTVFYPIASLLGNLIVDGCFIDLNSIKVKKIQISCGYAKKRSGACYVCLGDAAIHLAFYRSLNLGLEHALDLFIKISMLYKERVQRNFKYCDILSKFTEDNPHLFPYKIYPTEATNVFLVVTKIIWYGCYSYCLTNRKTQRLTNPLGVYEDRISSILSELNCNLTTWNYLLDDFEVKRDEDIKNEVHNNKTKSNLYDYASLVIDINGKSFIRISELARLATGKFPLFRKDFEFFLRYFEARREAVVANAGSFINVFQYLLNQFPGNYELKTLCAKEYLQEEEKRLLIRDVIHRNLAFSRCKKKQIRTDLYSYFNLLLLRNEILHVPNLVDSSNESCADSMLDDFVKTDSDVFTLTSLCFKSKLYFEGSSRSLRPFTLSTRKKNWTKT